MASHSFDRRHFIRAGATLAGISLCTTAIWPSTVRAVSREDENRCRSRNIKVMGIGGTGISLVEYMIASKMHCTEFICADMDSRSLNCDSSFVKIDLGAGQRERANLEKTRELAEVNERRIRAAIEGASLLFVVAGMGGVTGTLFSSEMAQRAREMGVLTVGVVTMPFRWEGKRLHAMAKHGISELKSKVDSLILVSLDEVVRDFGDQITLDAAFSYAGIRVMSSVVESVNAHS